MVLLKNCSSPKSRAERFLSCDSTYSPSGCLQIGGLPLRDLLDSDLETWPRLMKSSESWNYAFSHKWTLFNLILQWNHIIKKISWNKILYSEYKWYTKHVWFLIHNNRISDCFWLCKYKVDLGNDPRCKWHRTVVLFSATKRDLKQFPYSAFQMFKIDTVVC